MNYYPFHIGDYASKTRHLSWDEDMAYRRLLDLYYSSERPIPLELRVVFRLVMASTDAQREAVQLVLEEFFERTDHGWRSKRADSELETMKVKQDKQREKANKRWHKQRAEPGIAAALPQNQSDHAAASIKYANAMPPTPTPTPTPTPKEKTNTGAAALTVLALIADGLTEQTAGEFLALRKAKGARLTARAWQGVVAEAQKAGWTVEQAVCKSLARGWTGFEAAWVREDRGRNGAGAATPDEPEWRREQRERNEAFLGPYAAKRTANVIDMEAPNAAPVRVA